MPSQFEEVEALFRSRRYAEARRILIRIDHPEAEQRLQRIEDIESQPFMAAGPVVQPTMAEKPKEKVKMPWGEPWNPVPGGDKPYASVVPLMVFFMPFVFMPLMNIYLSLNWRRLGKPTWSRMALAASVTAGVGFWLSLPLMSWLSPKVGNSAMLFWIFFGGMVFWLYIVMLSLQGTAYKKWKEQGSTELYQHAYPVTRSMTFWAVGIVVLVGGIFGYKAYENQPRTFTDSTLTLSYDPSWTPVPLTEAPDCQPGQMDNNRRCVALFQDGQYGYTGFMIMEEPNNLGMTLEQVDAALWGTMSASSDNKLQTQWNTILDGQPAMVREYSFPGQDGEEMYAMLMITFKGDKFYRVVAYAMNRGIFEEDREAIQKLSSAIHFTP